MYRKIMVTALVILLAVIGVELAHPRRAPVPAMEPPRSMVSESLLDHKISELILQNSTIEQAMRAIQTKTDVPIMVDWAALAGWKNIPVDLDLRDINVGDAVAFLFSPRRLYIPTAEYADFGIVDSKLVVTSVFGLPTPAMTWRTYDVRDLLKDDYWGCPPGTEIQQVQEDRFESLCHLLENESGIENWRDTRTMVSATDGHERYGMGGHEQWAGRFFVRQTAFNHRIVESLLDRLRTSRSSLIATAPLDRHIDRVDFHSKPLRNALHVIAEKAHVSIALEPVESNDGKLDLDIPITVRLEDVSLDAALGAMKQLSGIHFNECEGGIVVISNKMGQEGVMHAIDASDLVKEAGAAFITGSPRAFYDQDESATPSGKAFRTLIQNFIADGTYPEFFGTRVIVRGTTEGPKRVRQMIDCLAHPVSLLKTQSPAIAGEPWRRIAEFHVSQLDPSEAFSKWRTLVGPNVVLRESPPAVSGGDTISFDLHDITFEDALRRIIQSGALPNTFPSMSIEDGIIYPEGNGGGILRAYDVSPLIKSGAWYHEDPNTDSSSLDERKGQALVDFIGQKFDGSAMIYWHGRLLAMTTPGNHRRMFDVLRHIQLTGQLPKEQSN